MHYPAPFLCLPLSLLHLASSAFFFFFPPFLSSSFTEGHKSGLRGKIWRRWELSSLKSDCVGGILGKPLVNTFAFRPPSAQPLCTSRGAKPVDWKFGGILLGSVEERGGGPRPRAGSCPDLSRPLETLKYISVWDFYKYIF